MPQVSVIMANRNHQAFIGQAIRSVISQSFEDWELIIVDDHSDDASLREIKPFLTDKRIKLLAQSEHSGCYACLNLGLEESNAPFVAILDSDDYWYPLKLEKQLAFISNNPEIDIIGTSANFIDTAGQITGYGQKPESHQAIMDSLFLYCPFWHSSVVIKASLIKDVGGYLNDKQYCIANDYSLWLRLLPDGAISYNIPEPLIAYRKHHRAVSNTHHRFQARCAYHNKLAAWKRIGYHPSLSLSLLVMLDFLAGYFFSRQQKEKIYSSKLLRILKKKIWR